MSWKVTGLINPSTLDKDVLQLMKESGCSFINMGLMNRKNINVLKEKMALIRKFRIKVNGSFIMGLPNETEEKIRETINLSKELDIDFASFSIMIPFPGSELFKQLEENGYMDPSRVPWSNFYSNRIVFPRNNINESKLKKLHRQAYLKFYLRWKILKSTLPRLIYDKTFFKRGLSLLKN